MFPHGLEQIGKENDTVVNFFPVKQPCCGVLIMEQNPLVLGGGFVVS